MAKSKSTKPTASEAAQRLLILRFQIIHAISNPPPSFLVEQLAEMEESERKKTIQELNEKLNQVCASLRVIGLWDAMTADEQKFVSTPAYKQEYGSYFEAECKIEAAVCLMWALKLIDTLPSWDAETDPKILSKIPSGHEAAVHLIKHAALQKAADLDDARDIAELWHWRSHIRDLEKEGVSPPKKSQFTTLDELVRHTAGAYHKKEMLPDPIDEDFPVYGKAYRDLNDNEWMRIRTASVERHRAFNWLCGFAPKNRWDKVPIEV